MLANYILDVLKNSKLCVHHGIPGALKIMTVK